MFQVNDIVQVTAPDSIFFHSVGRVMETTEYGVVMLQIKSPRPGEYTLSSFFRIELQDIDLAIQTLEVGAQKLLDLGGGSDNPLRSTTLGMYVATKSEIMRLQQAAQNA